MRAMLQTAVVACSVFCLTLSAAAALEQFIDDRTLVAGEIELSRVDPAALEAFLFEAGKNLMALEPGTPDAKEKELKTALAHVGRFVSEFKQHGGTSLYLVSTWELLPQGGIALIAPVPDEHAKAMASLLYSGSATGPAAPPQTQAAHMQRAEAIPGLGAVRGTEKAIQYIRAIQPKDRPDLKAALAAAGAAPLRIAAALDPATRAQMSQEIPQQILGKPSTLITRDLKWASLTATNPPGPSGKLVVQSTDVATAKQTQELIVAALGMLRQQPPGLKPEQTDLLTPTVQNDQLILELKEAQLMTVASALAGPLHEARLQAMRVQSMSNIRQILLACHMYAADNQGQWPDDLTGLEKYFGAGEQAKRIMTNPLRPEVKPAYVYLKPADPGGADAASKAVLYESHTDFGRGVAVGFADGHVEYVANRQRFDQLLAKAAAAPAE
jgi:prepilin-type processing-associated H-X9-DG protein